MGPLMLREAVVNYPLLESAVLLHNPWAMVYNGILKAVVHDPLLKSKGSFAQPVGRVYYKILKDVLDA
uniref:Uncharacterized protein n=1 Tax=Lepeophtheirus salmonis TaxID=72036 RepID=A0A0K2TEX2_LEPSM